MNGSNSSLNNIANNGSLATITGRGPVKNTLNSTTLTTATATTTALTSTTSSLCTISSAVSSNVDSKLHLYSSGLLPTVVKSELKIEDTDNKSQYEENVMQPPTPPESFCTNEDKLSENMETSPTDNAANAIAPLLMEVDEPCGKIQKPTQLMAHHHQQHLNHNMVEAYDLTNSTTPPLSACSSQQNNAAANQQLHHPWIGRKARIGKSMAREMVYAGNAVSNGNNSISCTTSPALSTATQTRLQPPAQTQHVVTALTPPATPQVASNISALPTSQHANSRLHLHDIVHSPTEFLLKTEIKAEHIKLEEIDAIDGTLQPLDVSMPRVGDSIVEAELKIIKKEPLCSNDNASFPAWVTQPEELPPNRTAGK